VTVRTAVGPIVIDAFASGADIVAVSRLSTLYEPVIVADPPSVRSRPGVKPWQSDRYAGRDSVAFICWASLTSADMALRVSSNTSSQSGGASRS